MTDGGPVPFETETASGSFLFSRSGLPGKKGRKTVGDFKGADFLKKAFPEKTVGEPFLEQALLRLGDAHQFGALMFRLDPLETAQEDSVLDREGVLRDLAEILGPFCRDSASGWGLYEPDHLCCFFPEKTDLDCMEIGRDAQVRLGQRRRESVSVGCARYPMADFSRAQVFENAKKAIDHAAFFGPGSRVAFDAVSLNISGDTRYQNGDIPGAIQEYRAALRIDPANVNVLNSLGVCHAGNGDWDQAEQYFEAALWLAPGEIMALYNLALSHQAKGDREKALGRYQEVLKIEKDHFETLFQIGRLYLEGDKPGEAETLLRQAASLRPGSGPANRYLAEACMKMGRTEEAIGAFKKAVKINPNDAASLSALGSLFDEIGENAEVALAFCEQSVKITPEEGLYWYRLGLLYLHQNRGEDAEKALSKALGLGHDAAAVLEKIKREQKEELDDGGF